MDNLAHALVGAALMRAVADRHVPRAGLIGVVAANVPDLSELLIGLPSTRADYLVLHRGVTHSLIGALGEIVALTLLVGVGWRLARWTLARDGRAVAVPAWGWLAAGIGAAVLSHLYMDWQGSYGWRPFLPWNNTWYYLDWVAIVDPFFWLVPLVALAWGAERHWIPLAAALVVGGTISVFLVRAHDIVATWVLAVYAIVCVIGAFGWLRYWFGPVGRQRAAALALFVLVVYAGAQAVVAGTRKREIRQVAEHRFGPAASARAAGRARSHGDTRRPGDGAIRSVPRGGRGLERDDGLPVGCALRARGPRRLGRRDGQDGVESLNVRPEPRRSRK